jgi:hypothetical protein
MGARMDGSLGHLGRRRARPTLERSAVLTVGSTQDGGLLECRYAQDDTKRLNVSEILLSAFVPCHDMVSSDT